MNCTGTNAGKWYSTSDSLCFNGLANNITFDFSSPNVVLPNSVVYGIAYNTSGYGPAPLGYATVCASAPGGCFYDSLNIALAPAVVVGSKPFAATLYQNTGYSSNYCDNGSGGTGTFRLDSPTSACWTGYIPAVQFTPTVAPPTNVSQCKKDGWKTFNNPSFKNQGDCVSYVDNLG